jgi:microcystin-dependent protein
MPAGSVQMYAGSTAPSGWLSCDGTAVSRTTFADLFAVLGTTYGSGDGSTTFTLPNMKGRVPVGLDSAQTEFDVLGETGGAKTHTLSTAEIPSHSHTIDHNHAAFTTTGSEGAHTHPITTDTLTSVVSHGHGAGSEVMGGSGSTPSGTGSSTTNSAGAHNHSIDVPNFTGSSGNQGSGEAHNNLQPYIVLNYIIKT